MLVNQKLPLWLQQVSSKALADSRRFVVCLDGLEVSPAQVVLIG